MGIPRLVEKSCVWKQKSDYKMVDQLKVKYVHIHSHAMLINYDLVRLAVACRKLSETAQHPYMMYALGGVAKKKRGCVSYVLYM